MKKPIDQITRRPEYVRTDLNEACPVVLTEPDIDELMFWKVEVQPLMTGPASQWPWEIFHWLHHGVPISSLSSLLAMIRLDLEGKPAYPLGLVWAFGPFDSVNPDGSYSSKPYLGYLSKVPTFLLRKWGLGGMRLGAVLMDAVREFGQLVSEGPESPSSFFLHAMEQGGDDLVKYYRNSGLNAIPENLRLGRYKRSVFNHRKNDGRYFCLLEDHLPHFRGQIDATYAQIPGRMGT